MIEINCEQGSEAWHLARVGVTTASTFHTAVEVIAEDARVKLNGEAYKQRARADGRVPGDPSPGSDILADEIALERLSEEPYGDTYQTYAMKRGSEMEKWARIRYEELYDCEVTESGIVLTDDRKFGYSTDGKRSCGKGLIEIKTPESIAKIRSVLQTNDISEYVHQIQGGLWLTGLEFCDLVMFVPPLSRVGNDIYVQRVLRDEDFIEKLERDLWAFEQRVQAAEKFWKATFRRDGLESITRNATAPGDVAKAVAVASTPRAMRSSLASMLSL